MHLRFCSYSSHMKIESPPPSQRSFLHSTPWHPCHRHPAVAALKQRVEAASAPGVTYNAVLLNYSRSGADRMGGHADSEGLYGLLPHIGASRGGGLCCAALECGIRMGVW